MESGAPGEVTVLLQKISSGDSQAADRLVPLVLQFAYMYSPRGSAFKVCRVIGYVLC